MKLWQGWHNTDLGRSYFHYGLLGGTKKQMGILTQTCKKRVSSLILIINTFNRNFKSTVMEMALIEIFCSYNVNKTHILRSKFQDNKSNIKISR